MTVAEHTFETWEGNGTDLSNIVLACKASRDKGLDFHRFEFDLAAGAGFDPKIVMDGLMTLGFSRSWMVTENGETGVLEVRW